MSDVISAHVLGQRPALYEAGLFITVLDCLLRRRDELCRAYVLGLRPALYEAGLFIAVPDHLLHRRDELLDPLVLILVLGIALNALRQCESVARVSVALL